MLTRKKSLLLCLSAAVVALDQASKWLIERNLDLYERVELIPGYFRLAHVTNDGIAFGLFPSGGSLWATALLATLGLVALSVVTIYFLGTPDDQSLLLTALALVLGGAVGNLTDRLMRGRVTDFFDAYVGTHHWPTFNVADSAISVGIVLLALETLRSRGESPASSTSPDGSDDRVASGA